MFSALGSFVYRRRGLVLLLAGLLTVIAAVLGPAVTESVKSGGFADPGSESAAADALLEETFGRSAADVVVVYGSETVLTEDPVFAQTVATALGGLPDGIALSVLTPWTDGLPADVATSLLGSDGHSALAVITLSGTTEEARQAQVDGIEGALAAPAGWTTEVGGSVVVMTEMQHLSESDIVRAEVFAMPVLIILLLVIFGGLVAALLPVTIGVVAILGALGLLRALTTVTDVSSFAVNVTTILGLGLAIDYSLFIVSRFREELARTDDVERAVRTTVSTAGRTVVFSGVTVLIAFAGLLFFPQMFLRSMGLGGMAVVLLDMLLAVTLLPALLAVLGRRVDAGRLPRSLTARLAGLRGGRGRVRDGARGWARVAAFVLRFPGAVAAASVALLLVLALPVFGLQVADGDARELPTASGPRQATERVAELFPGQSGTVVEVAVRSTAGPLDPGEAGLYLAEIGALDGVLGAEVVAQAGSVTHVSVATDLLTDSSGARTLVSEIRDVDAPTETEVLVGGAAATSADSIRAIVSTAPWTALFIAGVTLVLLFLALGSVVAPVKAVLLNGLSLAATFGVLTWAFVDGHLAGVAGFTAAGAVAPGNLVLVAVVAFGLAMDYELFLLSRIREAHLAGVGTREAITTGLVRSGSTITSAALLLVVVLAAMATSGVTFLKVVGLGLAFAVALDATVVRALLVPATLALLGRATWWLPGPLRRVHDRFGVSEGEVEDGEAVPERGGPETGAVHPPELVRAVGASR
ncbi:MMPL family transporter [Sanguibacter inulinus]|uniref:MMPL family transporter n=1 Tax=Sanguibacter inulinus TaxID=60922 RepID=A0A853F1A5_9MICO|nr:MMPL family transporter [Sanguibacter inulinus]MBF0724108.1 MMPL family transporter [Sanguibacter inulinus]NYS95253.1 MMPL family transporter [Sanguibacter inulinus]